MFILLNIEKYEWFVGIKNGLIFLYWILLGVIVGFLLNEIFLIFFLGWWIKVILFGIILWWFYFENEILFLGLIFWINLSKLKFVFF